MDTDSPQLYNVDLNQCTAPAAVDPWCTIELDPEYAGAWTVAADVDADGTAELITARISEHEGHHATVSVLVTALDGSVLWKWGNPEHGVAALHSDVACQALDWDNDGVIEVVVATSQHLIALDGRNGREKRRFPIPSGASDCLYFADLSAHNEKDVIVKDRYNTIWVLDSAGRELWHVERPAGYKTAHQPRLVPLDASGGNPGLILGFACYGPDGALLWDLTGQGLDDRLASGHLDTARALHIGDRPKETRLVLTVCGGDALVCTDGEGRVLWTREGLHYESVDIGRLDPDSSQNYLVTDIAHGRPGEEALHVLQEDGTLTGTFKLWRARQHRLIPWEREDVSRIVPAEPGTIMDGASGAALYQLNRPIPDTVRFEQTARHGEHAQLGQFVYLCAVADMDGDNRPELMVSTNPGGMVWLYKPPYPVPSDQAPSWPLGTEPNATLY